MGTILEDEATVTGNYQVLEKIFLKQLGLDEFSRPSKNGCILWGSKNIL
jgi:hypothetical protein